MHDEETLGEKIVVSIAFVTCIVLLVWMPV